jgi:hypothetical protein
MGDEAYLKEQEKNVAKDEKYGQRAREESDEVARV